MVAGGVLAGAGVGIAVIVGSLVRAFAGAGGCWHCPDEAPVEARPNAGVGLFVVGGLLVLVVPRC